jgi:hypothetical protein
LVKRKFKKEKKREKGSGMRYIVVVFAENSAGYSFPVCSIIFAFYRGLEEKREIWYRTINMN